MKIVAINFCHCFYPPYCLINIKRLDYKPSLLRFSQLFCVFLNSSLTPTKRTPVSVRNCLYRYKGIDI
nr:MAG TPA: hypothetical protein [Caudoviricetes sp.]